VSFILSGAGGSNSQVQYNSGGSLAGSANFTWSNLTRVLSIGSDTVVGSLRLRDIEAPGTTSAATAGALTIAGGSNSNVIGTGGSITVAGGFGFAQGGNVNILCGGNDAQTAVTSIFLRDENSANIAEFKGNNGTRQVGMFGVTPITRPTTAAAAATFIAGAGVAVQDVSTFDGYTIAQLVRAMRSFGWLT